MTNLKIAGPSASSLREDFVPAEDYVTTDFTRRENSQLWPNVWQMACRLEEIPNIGNYTTYQILDESIVIVRQRADHISAFHNVCTHRGNQIAHGRGSVTRLTCRFHGWQWDLEGKILRVKERDDWAGCPMMGDADLSLKPVSVNTWGGFVFVNLNPKPQPFEQFIDPVPRFLDCLEFERMTFIWYKTLKLSANWKTALESFLESYHVEHTHPQTLTFLDPISASFVRGKHGSHGYPFARPFGAPAARTGKPVPDDLRAGYVAGLQALADQIGGAVTSHRSARAVRRILDELPATATAADIQIAGFQFMKEAAEAEGAGFPNPAPEQAAELGVDWNVFPNMVLVFGLDSTLVFRVRPDGDDPHSCIFDMWGLNRQAPGREVPFEREYFEDWHQHRDQIPSLLVQDLTNIETIQRGMRSSSFAGSRLNPKQESQIFNLHRQVREYFRNAV